MTARKTPDEKAVTDAAADAELDAELAGLEAAAPPAAPGELPPAVFLIHPTRGHVVHVTAERAAADGMLSWAEATPAQIKAAGLAG